MDRKSQFQRDWLEENFDTFVADGIYDSHGRWLTVADSLAGLTRDEWFDINSSFSDGLTVFYETIEAIAKAYLLDTVVDELWGNHIAAEKEAEKELAWTKTSESL